ncbi:MAG: hypothetical protein AAF702_09015 [Chloroflexota bacterium]
MNIVATQNIQMFIALLLYLAFFGWVGWRRGTISELVVFLVALLSWVLLQSQGGVFRSIANLGGKFVVFIRSGGFSSESGDAFAALGEAPDVIPAEGQEIFVFLLWVFIIVLIYFVTNTFLSSEDSDGWSIILGIANGLLFAVILLPKLLAPLVPTGSSGDFVDQTSELDVLAGIRAIFESGLNTVWSFLEPQASIALLLLITLLLLLAATSLKGNGGGDSGDDEDE